MCNCTFGLSASLVYRQVAFGKKRQFILSALHRVAEIVRTSLVLYLVQPEGIRPDSRRLKEAPLGRRRIAILPTRAWPGRIGLADADHSLIIFRRMIP